MYVFVPRLAMIEQERRDRELALRLAQDPDAVDTEAAQQVPQSPLQRYVFRVFFFSPHSSVVFMPYKASNIVILRSRCKLGV